MALLSTLSSIVAHRFLIEELAGSGGMGSVYRARDLLTGQPVALKVLHVATPSPQDAERFAREARLLATLEHPGIVRYVAHGQTPEGLPFLAMEWLSGHDLLTHIANRPLSVEESLLLLRHVADALAVAHRRGIVHRDLKPSNLFLRDGEIARVTLLDFGIARDSAVGGGRALTRTGALMGTPGYMAPEQARGQSLLTASADIFSLGCVLYECLTGRPPFVGEHLEAILVKILFEPEVPLCTLCPELPSSLESLVAYMLEKEPSERLQNAMALLEEMDGLEAGAEAGDWAHTAVATEALTSSEQQLVSVFITRTDDVQPNETTMNPGEVAEAQERLNEVCDTLATLGVRTELLPDGTLVAALTSGRNEAATDQAQRAARCALLVRDRCAGALVALATGRGVVEGPLPIGEAINRAVKLSHRHALLDLSGPQADGLPPVVIDKATAGLLDTRFVVTQLDDQSLGLHREQPNFDETRRLLGKPTPCVGRESELGQLEALLSACIEESAPRALLVLGPAGVGKSRLRHEFLRRVASRGEDILVLIGRSDPLAAGVPFVPLREAIFQLCEVQPSDPIEARRDKLTRRIARLVAASERRRVVAFIGELCGIHFDDAQDSDLREARKQPRRMEDCIRQAVLDWLIKESAAHPIVLVLEDLHWGDASTVMVIDAALRELADRALFVVAIGRPEVAESFPRLWHERIQLMPLRPLSKKASELLVRQVLGAQTPPATVAKLVERAAGNALYLEELIRAAVEGEAAELPSTVLAMLQTRIGRLEAEARRALRAASVFGETSWSGGVARLLGMARSECERWLVYLVREELLEQRSESRFPDEIEYRFRHSLLRDAAYAMLSESDRLLGHRLAARFLESCDEQPATLAYHLQAADEIDQAVRYFMLAGDGAMRLGLFPERRRAYAAAEELFTRLPSTLDMRRAHVDTLLKQVVAGMTGDAAAVQLERLDKARRLHEGSGNDREATVRLLRIESACGAVCHLSGRPYDALRYFRKVQPIAESIGEAEIAATAALMIGAGLCIEGHFGQARDRLAWVLPMFEQLDDQREWLRGHSYYVMALAGSGRSSEALAQAVRGFALFGDNDHLMTLAASRVMRAATHMLCGNWPEVLAEGEKLLELATQVGEQLFHYAAWDLLAWAKSHLGQHDQALAARAQARQLRLGMDGGVIGDWLEAAQAEMLLNAGRFGEALEQARAVVTTTRPLGLLFSQALAERVWGEALYQLGGSLDDVESHFRAALRLCQEGEQVINGAFVELAWARVLQKHAGGASAASHFTTAITTLTCAGCTYAVKQAQASFR